MHKNVKVVSYILLQTHQRASRYIMKFIMK